MLASKPPNRRAEVEPELLQSQNGELMLSESDRFLEEVILSRKPNYEKQNKNEFLPKTNLQTIQEGEMSI